MEKGTTDENWAELMLEGKNWAELLLEGENWVEQWLEPWAEGGN